MKFIPKKIITKNNIFKTIYTFYIRLAFCGKHYHHAVLKM